MSVSAENLQSACIFLYLCFQGVHGPGSQSCAALTGCSSDQLLLYVTVHVNMRFVHRLLGMLDNGFSANIRYCPTLNFWYPYHPIPIYAGFLHQNWYKLLLTTTCTVTLGIFHFSNILSKEDATRSAMWDPRHSWEWSTAYFNTKSSSTHCAVKLNMLTWLTLEEQISAVNLMVTAPKISFLTWL